MSVFMIPNRTIDEIEKLLNAFWWGANSNKHKGIKWMRWERLAISKLEGGLGFKNLSAFNLAMLGKQAWRLLSNPNSLIRRIYQAKYYPKGSFLNASLGHNPSYTWKSLWSTQHLLKNGICWRLGNGNTIPVWGEPWIKYNDNYHCIHPHDPSNSQAFKVSDLMSNDKNGWNDVLINSLLDKDTSNRILNIPILNPHCEDKRIWKWNPSGSYTVRSAYKGYLQHCLSMGNLNVPGPWKNIWNLRIPHKIKHFIWRLMRDILPTRPNLQKKGIRCPSTCFRCNTDIENTWHTFFSCPSAKLCWQGSNLHSCILNLINSSDGVFNLISHILQHWTPQAAAEFSMILWSMWHSRNALHWSNTPWNPDEINLRASSMLHDWATANRIDLVQRTKTQTRQRWSPPPPRVI
uniref:Ribonuclease H protein At1g65750 family n=2 Tax=Cajanus cajan TaxID=3821 RepID=A0A151TA67_CAJCA|nr:Putative ribonuclease H protein At1g65750 family [Cajanus cajan]